MKAIVLCGGYAKRMWPLTKDKPKHLLRIAEKPMLEYVLEDLELEGHIDKIYVATNKKFAPLFDDFLKKKNSRIDTELVVEQTTKEEEKLGSIGALGKLINDKNINEEVLVIGGDNMFEFKIVELLKFLEEKNNNVLVLETIDDNEKAKLYGICEVDDNHKIINFEEKPQNPKSNLASTCCYILSKEGIAALKDYLNEGNDPDHFGSFINWIMSRQPFYGFKFQGKWFDIGNIEEYEKADKYFTEKLRS